MKSRRSFHSQGNLKGGLEHSDKNFGLQFESLLMKLQQKKNLTMLFWTLGHAVGLDGWWRRAGVSRLARLSLVDSGFCRGFQYGWTLW